MRKIAPGIAQQSRIERIMKYSANFFALMIVVFLVYGIVFLVNAFVPTDTSLLAGSKGLQDLSTVHRDISSGWNSFSTTMYHYILSILPQGKLPIWVYAIWSVIMVAIVEKIAGKRLRQLGQFR